MRVSIDENNACVSGTLSCDPEFDHQLFGEDFYRASVLVPRLSGTIDCVPLTIPGRLLAVMPQQGERVEISGQLRSYNRRGEYGSRLCVTLFVRSMQPMADEAEPENSILLTGYLCKPPVFRTTPFMREIGDMLLACNRSFNKSDYLPCIAWGRNARIVSEMPVGSRVRIAGRIQSRRYQKLLADGTAQDRTAHEVSCSSIELI
ncbi:MAG: single-stranded DNA-binding protein [Clostridia bacterium]|nr:single-stranded DNA-binding protein [Clostridia bacterium]